jgi:hypothetical protein
MLVATVAMLTQAAVLQLLVATAAMLTQAAVLQLLVATMDAAMLAIPAAKAAIAATTIAAKLPSWSTLQWQLAMVQNAAVLWTSLVASTTAAAIRKLWTPSSTVWMTQTNEFAGKLLTKLVTRFVVTSAAAAHVLCQLWHVHWLTATEAYVVKQNRLCEIVVTRLLTDAATAAQTLDAAQQAVVQTPAVQLQLLLQQKLSSQHQLLKLLQ